MDVLLLLGGQNWGSFGCLCPGDAAGKPRSSWDKWSGMGCWCPLAVSCPWRVWGLPLELLSAGPGVIPGGLRCEGFIPIFHSSGRMLAGKGGSSCRCDADSLRLSSASEHPFPVAQLGKGRHSLCCPGSRSCWDIPGAVPAVGKESWNGSEGLGSDSSAGAQVVPSPGACR